MQESPEDEAISRARVIVWTAQTATESMEANKFKMPYILHHAFAIVVFPTDAAAESAIEKVNQQLAQASTAHAWHFQPSKCGCESCAPKLHHKTIPPRAEALDAQWQCLCQQRTVKRRKSVVEESRAAGVSVASAP